MAKRLVKIAKELNVGTSTIVDYLKGAGYEIENKPTSKITPEMEDKLLREFQGSLAIKKEADKLEIGLVRTPEEKKVARPEPTPKVSLNTNKISLGSAPKVDLSKPSPEPPLVEKKVELKKEVPVVKESPKVEEQKPAAEEKEEETKPRLKILGKIDLDSRKKRPKPAKNEAPKPKPEPKKEAPKAEHVKKEVVEPKKEVPVAKEKPVEKPKVEQPKVAEKPAEKQKEAEAPKKDDVIRADAPQLKGLKILGKIDTNKFNRPKKKDAAKPAADNKKPAEKKEGASNDPKKRRRKRKTIVRTVANTGGGGNNNRPQRGKVPSKGKGKKDQPKEVSKKEIEEQIKATMARISGGGKNKRQKLRRDNRMQKREKKELEEMENDSTGTLQVTEFISVSELASLMDVSASQVITTCMNLGYFVTLNQRLDAEVIEIVASEFEFEIEFISAEEQLELDEDEEEEVDAPEDLESRSPIVTVMGHVDHGKTSLLDYIRTASVAEGEAGGITQHIGAYVVNVNGKKVTFLDTPGHEAFTAMRARGAKVTDVAIIIVAADDSIMPQTKEAISHAQAAEVPMIFAINKIDKDGANPDKIKQELAAMNLLVEEWGGDYQSQDISAKKGTGIDDLLEKIILESEILELKANPNKKAHGVVLEASLDKGRGYVAKTLVQAGTLNIGDPVVAGEYSGKVKAMFNEHGKRIKKAGPSTPVLVLGLNGAPTAGEKFKEMDSEQESRQLATKRSQINREQANRASRRISLDEIGRRLALGTFKELNLIIKGDVDGSVEALSDSLLKLSIETVQVNVIHKAVGQIIESDVLLASASDAIIIGFQVRPSGNARKLAEREGVEIKGYSIIYEAIEEIKSAIEGMLEPTKEERVTAEVQVRETFKISRVGTVAGCYVTDGKISRNDFIRVVRDGIVVYPVKEGMKGEISSLKRFKEDVKEVRTNFECGITVKNFNDIKVGDIIESYEIIEVKQKLS